MKAGADGADADGVKQRADRKGCPTDSAPEDQKAGCVQEEERKALHPLDSVCGFARHGLAHRSARATNVEKATVDLFHTAKAPASFSRPSASRPAFCDRACGFLPCRAGVRAACGTRSLRAS